MFIFSDRAGSDSDGETSVKNSDFTTPDGVKVNPASIVEQANGISIVHIFKEFNINIDINNKSTLCPFHSGGNERSPSFHYYPDSNRFHCFGCGKTGAACDLLVLLKQITKIEAALYILEQYGGFINSSVELTLDKNIYSDESVIQFSNMIREFISHNDYSDEAIKFADSICFSFDNINERYSVDHANLVRLIGKLKYRLEQYI